MRLEVEKLWFLCDLEMDKWLLDADDSARDASEIAHIASGQMESILAWPGKVGSTLSCRKVDGWREGTVRSRHRRAASGYYYLTRQTLITMVSRSC